MEPLVSVCIPAYNNAAYIKETIDSVLGQTYTNLELVICDDHSKDDTVRVIEEIKDDRIKLYKNEKNLGMSGNWNRCLSKCTGEFIKLICADDMLAPDALEKEVGALMKHPGAVLAESDTKLLFREKLFWGADGKYVPQKCVRGDRGIRSLVYLYFGLRFLGSACLHGGCLYYS